MTRFDIGKLVMTQMVNNVIVGNEQFAKDVTNAVRRYLSGDWGDLGRDDKKHNDNAVKSRNDRIVAAYNTSESKIYIITEWDRSYTTILFVDEY